jgi:hypothetical protein
MTVGHCRTDSIIPKLEACKVESREDIMYDDGQACENVSIFIFVMTDLQR